MEIIGGEHHIVPVEPEFSTVLGVEHILVSRLLEPASTEDHHGGEEVAIEASIVERSVSGSDESGPDGSHGSVHMEHHHPHIIGHTEDSVGGVLAIFSSTHFQTFEKSSDKAWSLSELLVY